MNQKKTKYYIPLFIFILFFVVITASAQKKTKGVVEKKDEINHNNSGSGKVTNKVKPINPKNNTPGMNNVTGKVKKNKGKQKNNTGTGEVTGKTQPTNPSNSTPGTNNITGKVKKNKDKQKNNTGTGEVTSKTQPTNPSNSTPGTNNVTGKVKKRNINNYNSGSTALTGKVKPIKTINSTKSTPGAGILTGKIKKRNINNYNSGSTALTGKVRRSSKPKDSKGMQILTGKVLANKGPKQTPGLDELTQRVVTNRRAKNTDATRLGYIQVRRPKPNDNGTGSLTGKRRNRLKNYGGAISVSVLKNQQKARQNSTFTKALTGKVLVRNNPYKRKQMSRQMSNFTGNYRVQRRPRSVMDPWYARQPRKAVNYTRKQLKKGSKYKPSRGGGGHGKNSYNTGGLKYDKKEAEFVMPKEREAPSTKY